MDLGSSAGGRDLGGEAEVSGPGNDVGERTHPSQRRWSDEERARIVSETYKPGASIKSVADRHGVSDTTLSKWRRRARTGSLPGAGGRGRPARGLRRDATAQGRAVRDSEQERPQRRTWDRADDQGQHDPAGACEDGVEPGEADAADEPQVHSEAAVRRRGQHPGHPAELRAKGGPGEPRSVRGTDRELVDDRAALASMVEPMLRARAALLAAFNHLHKMVLDAVRADPVCRRLMTVPGVGPVTALTFRATVDVPARFARSRAVGPHFGLTPRKWQSGEVDRMGQISKCGDAMMRTALYEAANSMLSRTTRWSWLKAWAMRVAKRRGRKRAKVALARRLGVIMHRIWMDGTEFQWTRVGANAAAAA